MLTQTAPHFVERLLGRCAALARTSELLFLLVVSAVSVVLAAGISYGMELLHIDQADRSDLFKFGVGGFFFIIVLVAPILETLLLQQLPISLARRFKTSASFQFAVGAIPFAAMHFESGPVTGIAAGIVGGAVLSLTYMTFIPQSKMKAFCMTFLVHALHNLVPFVLYVRGLP